MENNLETLWKSTTNTSIPNANTIFKEIAKRKYKQRWSYIILSITLLILLVYSTFFLPLVINNFSIGLAVMMGTLIVRICVERYSQYKKEKQLLLLSYNSYKNYLQSFYKKRKWINYVLTPICFLTYIYGFTLLLPYFKTEFSSGFYLYILISGFGSLAVLAIFIAFQIRQEMRFLKNATEL